MSNPNQNRLLRIGFRAGSRVLVAPLVLSLLVLACQPTAEAPSVETTDAAAEEIAWFEGTVEEAFATAATENKPLFLYWGAVWCPPCHYLKDKIFKKPDFVAQSRKFVAVYLDGDTDRAQAWGEELQTSGYPTVLIMNPAGEEVMRMSSGIPVEEYNGVLEAALAQMRPIDEVLEAVLAAGAENADPAELDLLANYSWGQDRSLNLSTEDRFATFVTLYEGTPTAERVIKSHFLGHLLDDAARLQGDEERTDPVLTADQSQALRAAVLELLRDPELRSANPWFISFSTVDTIDLLEPETGAGRQELIDAWLSAGAALESDPEMAVMDRLYAIYVRLNLAEMQVLADRQDTSEDEEVVHPEAELDHLRSRIAWANEKVTDEGELQGVMNVMAGLLDSVGLGEEAKTLVASRLEDTEAPHYYMSWLSSLEEDAGNDEAALEWSRRSYEESTGPYTRFQWGSGYVRDLLRLAADDLETIQQASNQILEELLDNDDAFANRNQLRLSRLDAAYQEWSADAAERAEIEQSVRGLVGERCEAFSAAPFVEGESESPRSRCESFANPSKDESAS